MGFLRLAAIFALTLAASAQSLSIPKLLEFLQSSSALIQQKKMTDKDLAEYLAKVKLTERLDDRTLENIQGRLTLGPRTLQALHKLRDESASLPAAAPLPAPVKTTPIPPPSLEEQAAIIKDVREYALNYSDNLPDFICTQVTRRFGAPLPGVKNIGAAGGEPQWRALDTLQIRLSFFQKKEQYKVVLMNNTLVNKDYSEMGGSKSFGEFGSMLRAIFEPETDARFEWDSWRTLRGKRVMAFRFNVRLERSKYELSVEGGKQDIVTAYRGVVEVERDTHVVLRVTSEAENIPAEFPIKQAENVLDYDYTELSGHTFLLPLSARVLMTGTDGMSRLEEEFRLYRKYSADSDIKFDADPLPPLPADKTKESNEPAPTPPARKQ